MSEQNGTGPTARAYHPRDHLVKIGTKEGLKDYYPAASRLYELTLRYPDANFTSEIVHLDVEHDFVIVKCCLYLGPDYSLSDKKTEARQPRPSLSARQGRDGGQGSLRPRLRHLD